MVVVQNCGTDSSASGRDAAADGQLGSAPCRRTPLRGAQEQFALGADGSEVGQFQQADRIAVLFARPLQAVFLHNVLGPSRRPSSSFCKAT